MVAALHPGQIAASIGCDAACRYKPWPLKRFFQAYSSDGESATITDLSCARNDPKHWLTPIYRGSQPMPPLPQCQASHTGPDSGNPTT